MKFNPFLSCLALTIVLLLNGKESLASQPDFQNNPNKTNQQPEPKSKFKYHEASTLSGIMLQPNRRTGTFTLKFDQQLTEPGKLEVKNSAGKVFYSGILEASKAFISRTLDIGKLYPGLYLIEVKTADTTFWKQVRVRR